MHRAASLLAAALLAIAGSSAAIAQGREEPPRTVAFEAASVKPSAPDARSRVDVTPGRFTAVSLTLQELVKLAYPIGQSVRNDDQIAGGPDWVRTQRFDVVATGAPPTTDARPAPGAVSPREGAAVDQIRAMLRTLLADRFALVVRHESRQLPVFALVRTNADRLGPQLRPVSVDCANETLEPPRAPARDTAACGGFKLGPGLTAHAVTIPMLVSLLSNLPAVGRIVEDRTGLTGTFDIDLSWSRDVAPPARADGTADAPPVTTGPWLFTAVQEQLGLKLEPSRGAVDVVVIERAEQPSPN